MTPKPDLFKNLFIFELANNHMGDVALGKKIMRELKEVCKDFDPPSPKVASADFGEENKKANDSGLSGPHFQFGFKLQYRDLDTFIHPDYKGRDDIKYVKRFSETRLSHDQFKELKDEITACGFTAICTPFDEPSVDLIESHDFDIIKIGSCSFTDWPLLERIVKTDKPIIASTAAASMEDIDRVVSFFEHRGKQFALMHCVGQYPTPDESLQLNQIDLLRSRYPCIPVGYSTHEKPDNYEAVKMAIAKGAAIFERHVGIKNDKVKLNDYSATPQQIAKWLAAAKQAFIYSGIMGERYEAAEKEKGTLLSLRRGIFAKGKIKKGEQILLQNVFAAIPTQPEQITMNDMSKYIEYFAERDIAPGQPVLFSNTSKIDNVERVNGITEQVKKVLKESRVLVPNALNLEISHHYGLDKFEEHGATIVNLLNREYCMKLIVLVPGQKHPEQHHKEKVETFRVLYGDVLITVEGEPRLCKPGDIVTIEKGHKHIFSSETGAVIEEISTTYSRDDSYYTDKNIMKNQQRKTLVTAWMDGGRT